MITGTSCKTSSELDGSKTRFLLLQPDRSLLLRRDQLRATLKGIASFESEQMRAKQLEDLDRQKTQFFTSFVLVSLPPRRERSR